jgi:hypothetical protein
VQGPEFKPQYCIKNNNKKNGAEFFLKKGGWGSNGRAKALSSNPSTISKNNEKTLLKM